MSCAPVTPTFDATKHWRSQPHEERTGYFSRRNKLRWFRSRRPIALCQEPPNWMIPRTIRPTLQATCGTAALKEPQQHWCNITGISGLPSRRISDSGAYGFTSLNSRIQRSKPLSSASLTSLVGGARETDSIPQALCVILDLPISRTWTIGGDTIFLADY